MGNTVRGAFWPDELPVHAVTLSSFENSQVEITQKSGIDVMRVKPVNYVGDQYPANGIGWLAAVRFCNKLSLKKGKTPKYYTTADY